MHAQADQTRFTPTAAEKLRQEIRRAGGVEVFAVGTLNKENLVDNIVVHCRGNSHSVPALLSRPRTGNVVIHNHPSGILAASQADMVLANLYGEDGVGVVIVNNNVDRAMWVVEPHLSKLQEIEEDAVRFFFEDQLPKIMHDNEKRDGQLQMALEITAALNKGEIALLEAGTGTGKSLAYLVPSVLWALKNDSKIIVSTYTINLQSQLVSSDLPLVKAAGLDFSYSLLKGRNNYLCRRRLKEMSERNPKDENLKAIEAYAQKSSEGTRNDMQFPIDPDLWEDIGSDHDQTLRAKCPHYEECFYYRARREAAKSQILVVNHHLLLSDVVLKHESGGEGILPKYNRIIIDEGHHLEDAATSMFGRKISTRSMRRSLSPLMTSRKKPGALEKIACSHAKENGPLPAHAQKEAMDVLEELELISRKLWERSETWMTELASECLSPENLSFRLKPDFKNDPLWRLRIAPLLKKAASEFNKAAAAVDKLTGVLEWLPEQARLDDPQPLLDLARSRRRLENHSGFLKAFPLISREESEDNPTVRWVEKARGRNKEPTAALCMAPAEAGPALREQLFSKQKSVTACSATMTVNKSFNHFMSRCGLNKTIPGKQIRKAILPSPFKYEKQGILAIPNDFPEPNRPEYPEAIAPFIAKAIRCCDGGVFILCTSFSMIRNLNRLLLAELGHERRILMHGEMGRQALLSRFMQLEDAILLGADSFWEGVNVKGKTLSMVIIPRLPFRVPTEPVQEARHELIEARGQNPFREYSLPQAALRLRQGAGRLIRSRSDTGAVLILDPRIDKKWYGEIFLNSLPPMRKIRTSGERVLMELKKIFNKDVQ